MNKEFFKAEFKRMKESGDFAANTRLIMPNFMAGGDFLGIAKAWWHKWYNLCDRLKVTDAELTGVVNLALYRKEKGIINYFPTDDEFRRLLDDCRVIKGKPEKTEDGGQKSEVRSQTNRAQAVNQRKSHLMKILCADCLSRGKQTQHRACDMCPVCYPEYSKAVAA